MESRIILDVGNLSKSFRTKKVVDGLSLRVEEGDVFGFLGPNGAGKTTTIRMILGLVHPDGGSVAIDGHDLTTDFMQAIAGVGAIVETPSFYPYLSGYKNLALIAALHPGLPKGRVDEVLEMVGLAGRAKDKVGTYSLGMKQRLGIARALLNHPKLIFLDEPTNGLDPQGMREVREMISQLALEHDITFFISTHLLHEVEQVCNKVAILKEGRLVIQSTVRELLNPEQEIIEVHTTDCRQAAAILGNVGFVHSVELTADGLVVETGRGNSARLNHLLVSGGINVQYLVPKHRSLESFFFELTEGGQQIA